MALNPAYASQPGRTLPLGFGYVKGSGDTLLFTTTPTGQNYNLIILGEGEWDGKEIPIMYIPPIIATGDGLGTGDGTTSLARPLMSGPGPTSVYRFFFGMVTVPQLYALLTSGSRFHPGRIAVKGAGIPFCSVGGGDQAADVWASNFPNVTPQQTFSGMAYELTLGPGPFTMMSGSGDDSITFDPTPNPLGVYRANRCRTFDADGNVTGYGFTVNPAWHIVEVILRYKIKPQQPGLAGLTAAEKACFNWPSVVAYAERCAYALSNGAPRFAGNYIFAADQTLTDMLETMLRCSRGYIVTVNGQITLVGDDGADSSFTLSGNHLVPKSLSFDKVNIAKLPNVFIPKFRDLNVPAVSAVVSIAEGPEMGLHYSSPIIPRYSGTVLMITDGLNPFTTGEVLVLGGSTDSEGGSSCDGDYIVGFPLGDGGAASEAGIPDDGVHILFPGPGPATLPATGGYIGAENARFAERAPTNVRHRAHQRATGGPDAPGLSPRLNVNPVEYDMGNNTLDQSIRVMTHEMIRSLGPDTDAWVAPFTAKLTANLESIDAAFNALIDQFCGKVITLDEWVSPEYTGDYEIQQRTITSPFKRDVGSIELEMQTRTDPSAYTDTVVEADSSYFTVPNSGLSMADRMPALSGSNVRPYMAMNWTPYWDGAGNVTADDCAVWWAGDVAPKGYAFSVSGLSPNTSYVFWMIDLDGTGTTVEYFCAPGTDFSVITHPTWLNPLVSIALGVFTTGPWTSSGAPPSGGPGPTHSGTGSIGSGSLVYDGGGSGGDRSSGSGG